MEKSSKGRFLKPEKLENLVFGLKKLLDAKGPFGDNVFKNPAGRLAHEQYCDAKWPETPFATSK